MIDEPAIPIRNLFHLLCYAWNHPLEPPGRADFGADRHPHLNELFARILGLGVSELLRGGLDRSYVHYQEAVSRVRGRIDFAGSTRSLTWMRGQLHCIHDDFNTDIEANRLIKSSLLLFANDRALNPASSAEIRKCLPWFADVSPADDTRPDAFRRIQIHRNNRRYRFVLSVCELIHASLLPDHSSSGTCNFCDFTRDEKIMATIFEKFVYHFAARRLAGEYDVSAMVFKWQAAGAPEALALLPVMRTDLTLRSADRSVILDCKYYADALATRSRECVEWKRVRSGHLYQLHAYLTNAAAQDPGWRGCEGILLYPVAGSSVDLSATLFASHPLRVVTLDLRNHWQEIERTLEGILRGIRHE